MGQHDIKLILMAILQLLHSFNDRNWPAPWGSATNRTRHRGARSAGETCLVGSGDEETVSDLFDVDGANLDRGFENLKVAEFPVEQKLRARLQEMWARYERYAEKDFRQGFARDVDGRFWEIYLGCTLLEAGRTLLPVVDPQRQGGQPDLCVVEDGCRIWI